MRKSKGKTITGSDGADSLAGGKGGDRLFGFAGKDKSGDVGAVHLDVVGTGFEGAVFASAPPGDPDRLYVLQKDVGEIHVLDPATGQSSLFLDIPDGDFTSGGEQGVLGLAFHPGYATNGRYFIHLVNAAGDPEIREYARSADTGAGPVQTILIVPHPTNANHNGGSLVFGPNDGLLYVGLGDGGGSNDPNGNAQNIDALLGKILRLDVDGGDAFLGDPDRNYAIPADNPFGGGPGADEVWAYGLRNPWRIAFDSDGTLYIADVGQGGREEIDVQPAGSPGGLNYGWDLAEGTLGNPPPGSVLPVFEYGRDLGRVVTGGEVYEGSEGSLDGAYFFMDFASNRMWTLQGDDVTERTGQVEGDGAPLGNVSSFGHDGRGGLYAVEIGGRIVHILPEAHAGDLGDRLDGGGGDDQIFGGPGDDDLRGGADADRLSGGYGADRLDGGKCRDSLAGDEGADLFVFAASAKKKNLDAILDFVTGEDRIGLAAARFGAIGDVLRAEAFHVGAGATTADHRIIYDPGRGILLYDKNGKAAGGESPIARLGKGLDLDQGDIVILG